MGTVESKLVEVDALRPGLICTAKGICGIMHGPRAGRAVATMPSDLYTANLQRGMERSHDESVPSTEGIAKDRGMAKKPINSGTLLGILVLAAALAGCGTPESPVPARFARTAATPLPEPVLVGRMSLEEALEQRRSIRAFASTPLTTARLGQLLWAAQGITDHRGFRTAPSAGGLYPLEVYVATAEGSYHYEPHGHRLLVLSQTDTRAALYQAALRQEAVRQAPAVFVITAVYERTAGKYGTERSPRYAHLEAGHAAQNLLLQAVALGLGAVPIGAFEDEAIQKVLGIPADHLPLYLIPVGYPQEGRQ